MKSEAGLLSVNLGLLKRDWDIYCKARNVTPSDATRQVIRKLVGREVNVHADPMLGISQLRVEKVRVEIRLTVEEHAAVKALAENGAFSVNSWIIALLRARLTGTAQLGQSELENLATSNGRLLAIGRNLNQITRRLNAAPTELAPLQLELVESIASEIKSHTVIVGTLIQSNIQRWSRQIRGSHADETEI